MHEQKYACVYFVNTKLLAFVFATLCHCAAYTATPKIFLL